MNLKIIAYIGAILPLYGIFGTTLYPLVKNHREHNKDIPLNTKNRDEKSKENFINLLKSNAYSTMGFGTLSPITNTTRTILFIGIDYAKPLTETIHKTLIDGKDKNDTALFLVPLGESKDSGTNAALVNLFLENNPNKQEQFFTDLLNSTHPEDPKTIGTISQILQNKTLSENEERISGQNAFTHLAESTMIRNTLNITEKTPILRLTIQ